MSLGVTILGSGTSTGCPVLGCRCDVCKSKNPKNNRWRSSILVKTPNGTPIVVDTGPEFRLQLLRAKVIELQHVLYTHLHADHCHGFDDLRGLYFNSGNPIHCFLDAAHAVELRQRFHYAFEDTGYLGGRPEISLIDLPANGEIFSVADVNVQVLRLPHGNVYTSAFRFGDFAYATDFKTFPDELIPFWKGKIHTMVASGLRWRPHKTHSVIEETLALFERLGVRRGIISHLNHEVDYEADTLRMPPDVELAYDGLTFQV